MGGAKDDAHPTPAATPKAPLRVLLADDHQIFRQALASLLEKDMGIQVTAQACDGHSAIELARTDGLDIAIVDIAMPGINGIEATRQIVASNPRLRVIILSAYGEMHFVTEALNAGAGGYVVKSAAADELVRAVHTVAAGGNYLSPEVTSAFVATARHPAGVNTQRQLGKRERQVLQLIAAGKSSAEIGRELFISPGTVDVHRRNIMNKLGLHSVAELTKWAIRHGLVSL
jgi:two-component system NarL family response regulator